MDQIEKALLGVGVPPHLDGFTYLHDAAALALEDRKYLKKMTGQLYPAVAERNHTTACRVERGMRHAVETCFNRTDPETLRELFGMSVDPSKGKATNSEFLAALTLTLRE